MVVTLVNHNLVVLLSPGFSGFGTFLRMHILKLLNITRWSCLKAAAESNFTVGLAGIPDYAKTMPNLGGLQTGMVLESLTIGLHCKHFFYGL